MSSLKSTPVSVTPVRKKTPSRAVRSGGGDCLKVSRDENRKPPSTSGTPLSHLKSAVSGSTSLAAPSPANNKTPFSSHNKTSAQTSTSAKSPSSKVYLRPVTPKNAFNTGSNTGNDRQTSSTTTTGLASVRTGGILKSRSVLPSVLPNSSTPKQQSQPGSSANSRPTTPKAALRSCRSPSRCLSPSKVETPVLVHFSKNIFSTEEESLGVRPLQLEASRSSPAESPCGMFNRSHSASSLPRLKRRVGGGEEGGGTKAFLKRSLSEAKLSLDFSSLSSEAEGESSSVTVGVRLRPLLPREGMNGIHVSESGEVKVASDLGSEHSFSYDHCFSVNSSQGEVYEALVRPLLDNAFQGYNACLFAYGQTGSGKTYSMMGPYSSEAEGEAAGGGTSPLLSETAGMIPRFCSELLQRKAALEEANPSFSMTVQLSYLEVYNEKIHDLLVPGSSQLRVREHPVYGPYVVDLSQHTVNSFQEFQHWMNIGNKKRAVAATEQNDKSSRSHSLFTVKLTQSFAQVKSDGSWSHEQTRRSQINLVDLAGSERIASSVVSSDRLREGVSINRSLLTLGKVITALVDKRGFVPYRESVLTWLLKESLGGNSRTCMLATVSPCSAHMDESLSTLRYASQARAIVNRVRVNEEPHDREIRLLREELERHRRRAQLLGENEELIVKMKRHEERNKDLEEELCRCKSELMKCEEMKSQLLKEVSDLSNESVTIRQEESSKYESELKNWKEKFLNLQKEYDALKATHTFQMGLFERKTLEYMKDETRCSNLQIEIKHLKSALSKAVEELEVAHSNNAELKTQLKLKENETADVNKRFKENDDKICELETKLKLIEEKFSYSEKYLQETKELNEQLNKKIEELSSNDENLKQDLEQIPALESALNDFEIELIKCKDELFKSQKSREELEKENEKLHGQFEESKKKLVEALDREELLKIQVEKIPNLEGELRFAQAEARKAKRELEEYLSQSTDSDESNELNGTFFDGAKSKALNDSLFPVCSSNEEAAKHIAVQTEVALESPDLDQTNRIEELEQEVALIRGLLKQTEAVNSRLLENIDKNTQEKDKIDHKLQVANDELFKQRETVINLQEKTEDLVKTKRELDNATLKINNLENELSRIKNLWKDDKNIRSELEGKVSNLNQTVKNLLTKADNAVRFEIELGKAKEELENYKKKHLKEMSELRCREESLKAELAVRNQQTEEMRNQLETAQTIQKDVLQENLGLIKLMKKKCADTDSNKSSTIAIEKNIELKKEIDVLKEKLTEKDKQFAESQNLLRKVIEHEESHEKALMKAKLDYASEVYEFTMENAYPHHLNYLLRKARKFTETYKIPYEFELSGKSVILRHLVLSAKASLNHLQLSKWIDKIETGKIWYQSLDKDIPWEVDFRDYYDKNLTMQPPGEESTEADNAINCGVQISAAGCINPILWRKTMVKRHMMGIREDSEVLIRYFNESEDSRIYSILSRIQVAVARLQEATQNVEK